MDPRLLQLCKIFILVLIFISELSGQEITVINGKCYAESVLETKAETRTDTLFKYSNIDNVAFTKEEVIIRQPGKKIEKTLISDCQSADCYNWVIVDLPPVYKTIKTPLDPANAGQRTTEILTRELFVNSETVSREVACPNNINHELIKTVRAFLSKNHGYKFTTLVERQRLDSETREALISYQKSKGLAQGQLDIETLSTMGISVSGETTPQVNTKTTPTKNNSRKNPRTNPGQGDAIKGDNTIYVNPEENYIQYYVGANFNLFNGNIRTHTRRGGTFAFGFSGGKMNNKVGIDIQFGASDKRLEFTVPNGYDHDNIPTTVSFGGHYERVLGKQHKSHFFTRIGLDYTGFFFYKEGRNNKGHSTFSPRLEFGRSFVLSEGKYEEYEYTSQSNRRGYYYYRRKEYSPHVTVPSVSIYAGFKPLLTAMDEARGTMLQIGARLSWTRYPVTKTAKTNKVKFVK